MTKNVFTHALFAAILAITIPVAISPAFAAGGHSKGPGESLLLANPARRRTPRARSTL
jgi:hypothetical protein